MIILNLFIGVIIQGMEEAQAQREIEQNMGDSKDLNLALENELLHLEKKMNEIQKNMERIKFLAKRENRKKR
jgi:Mg2+ and Co2+ transporter CorA